MMPSNICKLAKLSNGSIASFCLPTAKKKSQLLLRMSTGDLMKNPVTKTVLVQILNVSPLENIVNSTKKNQRPNQGIFHLLHQGQPLHLVVSKVRHLHQLQVVQNPNCLRQMFHLGLPSMSLRFHW